VWAIHLPAMFLLKVLTAWMPRAGFLKGIPLRQRTSL
jgi:hypothetical protein